MEEENVESTTVTFSNWRNFVTNNKQLESRLLEETEFVEFGVSLALFI